MNLTTSISAIRLPVQARPIDRNADRSVESDTLTVGVQPSMMREAMCRLASEAGSAATFGIGAGALYEYCMGPGGW